MQIDKEPDMKSITDYRLLALAVMLALGLAACAGKDKKDNTPDQMTEQFRQEILNTVSDSERAQKAAKLADQLRELFVDAEKQNTKDIKTFRSLNTNYDARESAFQGFFMNMNNQARARQKRVLKIHAKMQKLLTAEEWKKLEDAREDALNVDLKTL